MDKSAAINIGTMMNVGGLVSGALLMNKLHSKLKNDIQRKSMLEDLHRAQAVVE